jgi:hypothetical protein
MPHFTPQQLKVVAALALVVLGLTAWRFFFLY